MCAARRRNPADSLGRALVSLSAIGVTTLLLLRNHSAQAMRRKQARLLDLTHDTVFVRDMRDVITYFQSVVAPFDGVVTQRNINVGDLVQAAWACRDHLAAAYRNPSTSAPHPSTWVRAEASPSRPIFDCASC